MPEYVIDKPLEVLSVVNATELATGDIIYQVTLGTYVNNTTEIRSRIPTAVREAYTGKKIGITELVLFIKLEQIPYKIGSKWRLRIRKNGSLNLVEAK